MILVLRGEECRGLAYLFCVYIPNSLVFFVSGSY